ncbi:cob(I)yrinic acid a,c-diamide adenosyltransferase [Nibricoccus aquaticus]|uniref:corrinoid adenosyltransferase n=1 Tax=Nibricoccus aquaticus TaxID=2576891 RepID=A0A290QD28_9BACT|nr:cob(I)yrinic acid a,c-diamide adenosyltransferase [Nibricoccus aquaticus]ATC63228.1 cob(I)yrinic acid a,c-diamide adenosyltransferase [Nibricoccus aquaticus]
MPTPRTPAASDEDHRAQMEALQTEMHAKMRAAKEKRGLLIVHTGDGKGKTTAAFGMLTRMLATGKKCAVIQFIKSGADPLEKILQRPTLTWHRVGGGFTWDTQDRAADIASCREGWDLALRYFADPDCAFVLLDELNIVLAYDYLPKDEILTALRAKQEMQHIVITGRGALPELIELADLVTEMREIKHPFKAGIKAQRGIDF